MDMKLPLKSLRQLPLLHEALLSRHLQGRQHRTCVSSGLCQSKEQLMLPPACGLSDARSGLSDARSCLMPSHNDDLPFLIG
jgi:hypothetical protein